MLRDPNALNGVCLMPGADTNAMLRRVLLRLERHV
jgi:hypothetical protein